MAATLRQLPPDSLAAPALNVSQAQAATVSPMIDTEPPVARKPAENSSGKSGTASAVELRLIAERPQMRVGEKQRIALAIVTPEALGAATFKLRFNPHGIAVRGVSQGTLLSAGVPGTAPTLLQSIDPAGTLFISVQTPASTPLKTGRNILIFVEVEAMAGGLREIVFDQESVRLTAPDGRTVRAQFVPVSITVRQ